MHLDSFLKNRKLWGFFSSCASAKQLSTNRSRGRESRL